MCSPVGHKARDRVVESVLVAIQPEGGLSPRALDGGVGVLSPVRKCEGPGAPSEWFRGVETEATRLAAILLFGNNPVALSFVRKRCGELVADRSGIPGPKIRTRGTPIWFIDSPGTWGTHFCV